MKRLILLAVLIVAFCAMPAFANTQNVKVDGDLDSTLVIRNDFDLGTRANGGFGQNLFITQTRVGVSADLTDNVGVKIKMINERPWGEETGASNTDVDINEAFVQFREFIYSPATVAVGLQPLRFGNALIIGDPNTNNRVSSQSGLSGVAADLSKEKAFDSVRLTLDYNPLTIDIFGAKIDSNVLIGSGEVSDDVDLFGWNNNYKFGDKHNTEGEVYFFAKRDNSVTTTAGGEADTVFTPGGRVSTNVLGLNLQGEVAWQRGNKNPTASNPDNQRREAMAAQIIASHQIAAEKTKKYNPVVALWGTYLSGDSNSGINSTPNPGAASGEKYTAWDPMFEDQAGGTIYNTLFDYSNVRLLGGSLSFNPMEDVMMKTTFTGLWLDKNIMDSQSTPGQGAGTILRQPDGSSLTTSTATSNTHIGNELDVDLVYNYSEDVQIGMTSGWFFPGSLFHDAPLGNGNDDVATQFLLNADVAF